MHKAYGQQVELLVTQLKKSDEKVLETTRQVTIMSEAANYFRKKMMNADLEIKKLKKNEGDLYNQLEMLIQEKLKLKLLSVADTRITQDAFTNHSSTQAKNDHSLQ